MGIRATGDTGLMGFNQFGGVVEYLVCVKKQHTVLGEVSALSTIHELRIIFLTENLAGRGALSALHYMNFEE